MKKAKLRRFCLSVAAGLPSQVYDGITLIQQAQLIEEYIMGLSNADTRKEEATMLVDKPTAGAWFRILRGGDEEKAIRMLTHLKACDIIKELTPEQFSKFFKVSELAVCKDFRDFRIETRGL